MKATYKDSEITVHYSDKEAPKAHLVISMLLKHNDLRKVEFKYDEETEKNQEVFVSLHKDIPVSRLRDGYQVAKINADLLKSSWR